MDRDPWQPAVLRRVLSAAFYLPPEGFDNEPRRCGTPALRFCHRRRALFV